ncbi:hypothetical protein PIB30_059358 [Stylosanthes scabra]|uniref:Uncharacterized protein n=1 Tax=Stylosanthes scabra TaxID=79078 RepID=A0ABU6WNJ4_9FABA|nr:hypothetical protein [Stylosanthes scabra]
MGVIQGLECKHEKPSNSVSEAFGLRIQKLRPLVSLSKPHLLYRSLHLKCPKILSKFDFWWHLTNQLHKNGGKGIKGVVIVVKGDFDGGSGGGSFGGGDAVFIFMEVREEEDNKRDKIGGDGFHAEGSRTTCFPATDYVGCMQPKIRACLPRILKTRVWCNTSHPPTDYA